MFDLGRIMEQKQERECARLDDFEFRLKIRTVRQLVQHAPNTESRSDIATQYGRRAAAEPLPVILREVRRELFGSLSDSEWMHTVEVAGAKARSALILERGDPSPYRMS